MALPQFTQQFITNLPIINRQTLKDFNENLQRTTAVDRINFISDAIYKQRDYLPRYNWFNGKDDIKSHNFRTTGNAFFGKKEFVEALKCYNKAIAFATSERNLSIAYANRSAAYYELSLFDFCLENIELARSYRLSDKLKMKLDERQQAAVARFLSKPLDQPKSTFDIELCRPPMQRQPFFINCLAKLNDQIVTKEPLRAGDAISLERPYSQILRHSHVYERCTYCLTNKKYLSMIPCMHCSTAMFCNHYCYGMAQKLFHSYECPIIDGLYCFLPDFIFLGLRTVLVTINRFGGLTEEYRKLLMRSFLSDTDSFDVNVTQKNRNTQEMIYLIIHNMERSWSFSMQHHLCTAVLMEKLKSSFTPIFEQNPSLELVLSTSIFHMIQVSMENSILLEETGFTGNCIDDDITIYGCGLFPFASNFKMLCVANVLLVNRSGMLSGIVLHPIKAGEVIVPGIISRNHFLMDMEHRINLMKTFTSEFCHCIACVNEFEIFTELPPVLRNRGFLIHHNKREPAIALKVICKYLNRSVNMTYLSWQMGWCLQAMVRVLRQLAKTYDTNTMFAQFSMLERNS